MRNMEDKLFGWVDDLPWILQPAGMLLAFLFLATAMIGPFAALGTLIYYMTVWV